MSNHKGVVIWFTRAFRTSAPSEGTARCWHAGQAYTYAQSAIEAYAPVGREEAIQEQYQAWINESPESL